MLFRQVSDFIEEQIGSGEIPEGMRIPTVSALREKFRVSHVTVLRAFRELLGRGVIVKKGKCYVAAPPRKGNGPESFTGTVCALFRTVVPYTKIDNYTNDIICGIYRECLQNGFALFTPPQAFSLSTIGMWQKKRKMLSPELLRGALDANRFCDGFLFDERVPDDVIRQILDATGKPGVLIDRHAPDLPLDAAVPANRQAMKIACETAWRYGYRRFLYIKRSKPTWNSAERDAAFQEFSAERLKNDDWACVSDWTTLAEEVVVSALYKAFDKLRGPGKPVAVIASFDRFCQSLLELFTARGAVLCRDYGLCGVGGMSSEEQTPPLLTAVRADASGIGQLAVRQLLKRISGSRAPFAAFSPEPLLFCGETL